MDPYDGRSAIRRLLPYAVIVWGVLALALDRTVWHGLVWLLFGAEGLTLPWRVLLEADGVTLWFSFRRPTRYQWAEVVLVKGWRSRSLALKGRGWWHMYALPGSIGPRLDSIDAAAQSFGYTTVHMGEAGNYTRRRPKARHDEPQA